MFCSAVSVGSRLNDWKTKPILSRRTLVTWRSGIDTMSTSPMNTDPAVGRSRPAMQCISVDLPDPDGPMIAVNEPLAMATETSSTATTGASPVVKTFLRCWVPHAGIGMDVWVMEISLSIGGSFQS